MNNNACSRVVRKVIPSACMQAAVTNRLYVQLCRRSGGKCILVHVSVVHIYGCTQSQDESTNRYSMQCLLTHTYSLCLDPHRWLITAQLGEKAGRSNSDRFSGPRMAVINHLPGPAEPPHPRTSENSGGQKSISHRHLGSLLASTELCFFSEV